MLWGKNYRNIFNNKRLDASKERSTLKWIFHNPQQEKEKEEIARSTFKLNRNKSVKMQNLFFMIFIL